MLKPRFFSNRASWLAAAAKKQDGFYVERVVPEGTRMIGRIDGREHVLVRVPGAPDRYEDDDVAVELDPPTGRVLSSRAIFKAPVGHVLPLWRYFAARALLEAVLRVGTTTPVGALLADA